MSVLTAAFYGVLLVYGAGWFMGYWIGNFSLLLFVLTMVTLGYWLAERFRFAPARQAAAAALQDQESARRAQAQRDGIQLDNTNLEHAREAVLREQRFEARAAFGFWPAAAVGDDIALYADESRQTVVATLT